MVEVKSHPLRATGKADLQTAVESSKVLVVGAGGIGCELLKNLVLSGFRDIVIIDLDTIDVSNLNRQFLFQKQHVSQSKAKIARESALSFEPEAKIEALHDSITTPQYGVNFFKQFTLVMNALDNRAARNHVNRLCLAAEVPLIESGTAGYFGQVSVIKKGTFECYECQPKPPQRSFPGCTIRNTPSEPIHCIVWSKHLFNQLFGEEDADEDVSPDTDDPELGGNAGQRALNKGSSDGESAPSASSTTNGTNGTTAMETNGGSSADNKKPADRVSTRAWAKEVDYDPKKLFMKFFNADIKYLLSMDKLWEKRRPPVPLDCDDLPEEPSSSNDGQGLIRDQKMWSLKECFAHFQQAVSDLKDRLSSQSDGVLVWDKDDDPSMDFVTACANVRAAIFGIPRKSRFDVKSMAGNIIPAIATTNAVIAGAIVVEAFKILQGRIKDCKSVILFQNPNPFCRLIIPSINASPNPNCSVCAPKPQVFLKLQTDTFTVKHLEDKVLKGSLNMIAPDVNIDDNMGTILISSEEGETEANNNKPLGNFGVRDGTRLLCDDFLQNYSLAVVIIDSKEPLEDGQEFVVMGKDALETFEEERKKVEAAKAEVSFQEVPFESTGGKKDEREVDLDDDDLVITGEKTYGMDDEDVPADAGGEDMETSESGRKRKRGAAADDGGEGGVHEPPAVKKVKPAADSSEPELVSLD